MNKSGGVEKAAILAAGEGTRLRPLTLETPKALLPIGGRPLIAHTINWLQRHSVSRIMVNLHHRGDMIRDFLGDGSHFGVQVEYSYEETLLGTAGALKKMEDFFDSTMFVVYGDVLTNFDLTDMIRYHRQMDSVATLALVVSETPWQVGMVRTNSNGRVTEFVEKPARGTAVGNLANGGVYLLEPGVLRHIPDQTFSDFGHDIFPEMIRSWLPVFGYALPKTAYLIDIGTSEKYAQANRDLLTNVGSLCPGGEIGIATC